MVCTACVLDSLVTSPAGLPLCSPRAPPSSPGAAGVRIGLRWTPAGAAEPQSSVSTLQTSSAPSSSNSSILRIPVSATVDSRLAAASPAHPGLPPDDFRLRRRRGLRTRASLLPSHQAAPREPIFVLLSRCPRLHGSVSPAGAEVLLQG